ncbi:unnamed protein product [Symbiodinium sp. CCMP2592]|nr:unnamed protein product [Symbiodinium sp. CCMP2592]
MALPTFRALSDLPNIAKLQVTKSEFIGPANTKRTSARTSERARLCTSERANLCTSDRSALLIASDTAMLSGSRLVPQFAHWMCPPLFSLPTPRRHPDGYILLGWSPSFTLVTEYSPLRLTDVHDPSAVGLFMAFAGREDCHFWVVHAQADFGTLPDGCLQLRRDFARSKCTSGFPVLDLIIAPPGAAAWWIVKDTIGCELLRPVVQHYVSQCSFFFCAIEPDGAVYSVEPSAEVRFMTPSPHGARALVAKVLPGLVGRVVDGVLQVVAAKAGSVSLAGGLALLLLSGQAASMQTAPELPLVPAIEPPALPAIMRIWTLNVRQPVDLPWRAEGCPTRWLRDLMRRLHSIDDPGEFRSTCGPRDSGVQHVLSVPLVPPTVPRNRFWLLHWGEAAVVAFGHTPFSWDVVSAHLRTLFPGGQVPDRCPAIAYAGAFYPPGAALPDLPFGAIIQLLIGALARVPSEDDPWHPEPYVVDGPWFQHVPSKGPALEPAILIDAGGSRRPDGYVPTTLVDQGTQTDLSGNGYGLALPSPTQSLLTAPGQSLGPPEVTAAAAALPPDVDLLDMGSPSGCQQGAASSWALLVFLGMLGPPPPDPVNAPFQPRLLFLRAARPLEDYALGLWPPPVDREPAADEDAVRRVQSGLLNRQRGLRTFAAAIPLGTPFCIHNPFTARPQCEMVEYAAGPEINPLTLFASHARHRGWAGLVLLQPQPDSSAVHLIGCPVASGNAAVGIVFDDRLIPCCLPNCVPVTALGALVLEGHACNLNPPEFQEGSAVVQFRNGDCLAARRCTARTAASHLLPDIATASHPSATAAAGGFPWGVDPANRDFSGITADDPVYVVLHSPFQGVFPPYTASQETRHSQVWAQFLNDDPGWASEYFPVWPGPAFNELSIVPVGQDAALVTIMLVWRGHHRATLTPRTMTVDWLTAFIARHINHPVGGISLPHGLAVSELFDVPPAAFRFRNGDVVHVHDPPEDPSEPLEFVEPWHLQDGLAAHHAPWAVGFQLMFGISVHLLRPERPPLLASIAAGEAWCPETFTFSGTFQNHFPGMWTPVQWTRARALQLIEVNGVAAKVNIVAATPEGRLCRSVDRITSRDHIASQLNFLPATICVGGVPSYAIDQACELRNGDVIFGHFARSTCFGRSHFWGLALASLLTRRSHPGALAVLLFGALGLRASSLPAAPGPYLLAASMCLPAAHAMHMQASASSAPIPVAAPPRLTVTVANPFASWARVEVDPQHLFDAVIADAHHTLTSWHKGFAATGLVFDGAQVVVPLPGSRLVCILVAGLGQLLCVVLPAFLTPRDLMQAIQMRLGRRVCVSLPPGLAAAARSARPVLALRSGDVVSVHPPQLDPLAGPREPPVFLTWGAAHAAAARHSDFVVAHASCVLLWSPCRPARIALLGHQARWDAAAATVQRHEHELGSHRWAPCHGHLGAPPWLVEQSAAEGRANIIQSRDSTRCIEIARDAAHDLYIDGFSLRPASSRACSVANVRDGDWWVLSAATGLLARRGSLYVQLAWFVYSFATQGWAVSSGASSGCPSVDSSEARTIRTRRRPSRSRSPASPWPGRFFPPRVDFNDGEPVVIQGGWQPDSPDCPLARCFPGPRPQTARVLCPLRGWSEVFFADLTATWQAIELVGSRHCGSWARKFFPVRSVLLLSQITVAPVAPYGLATVVFHLESCSAVALAPVDSSLADIHRLATRVFPHTRFWRVVAPPVLSAANPHTHVRLRNGDAFSLVPENSQPEATRFPLLQYTSLERARQVASWSLPFRFDVGGLVFLWYTNRKVGHCLRIRDAGYWNPDGPTFWSLNGEALSGSWVPVLIGDLSSLHLMHRTSIGKAHVLFLFPPDLEPVGRLLAGCNVFRTPPGWRLLPALQCVRADSSLRDGDVLVLNPTADLVWDPFGPPPLVPAEPEPGTPPAASPAAARPAFWAPLIALLAHCPRWTVLALSLHMGLSMVPVAEVPEQPIRAGLYPWRMSPREADLVNVSSGTELDIVYLSPFTGPQEAGRLPAAAPISELNSLTRACDPVWGADVVPVWPTAAIRPCWWCRGHLPLTLSA